MRHLVYRVLAFSWKTCYNVAWVKRTPGLANTLDSFARGLHAHVSLFICTFSRQFFRRCWRFSKHKYYFTSARIWKNLFILPEIRTIFPVSYQIWSSIVSPGTHLQKFANLSEQEGTAEKPLPMRSRFGRRIKNEHVIVMALGNTLLARGIYKQLDYFGQSEMFWLWS